MRRREFIARLGSLAATLPVVARAQQVAVPVIGFLHGGSPEHYANYVTTFRQSLSETGFVEGRNLAIEYRWAEEHPDRLILLATDLVRRQVNVIVAWGPLATRAAKMASTTIPIVFLTGGDPVAEGLVDSFNRPGDNVTGVSFMVNLLVTKRLQLLQQLVPKATSIATLVNPNSPTAEADTKEVHAAAQSLGLQAYVLNTSTEGDLDAGFASLAQLRVGALLIGPDPFFTSRRDKIVALAARLAVPTSYFLRESVEAGGLMSYGASLVDGYRQVGIYASRVLSGAKPTDLPVMQPTKFELVINLKTANALGLTIPETLLATADEVIQ
jgi:putative ABC transport system substrate-binding protein